MSQSGAPMLCVTPKADKKKRETVSIFLKNRAEAVDPNVGVVKSLPLPPQKKIDTRGSCVRPAVDKPGMSNKSIYVMNQSKVVDPVAKIEPERAPVLVKTQAQLDAERRGQMEDEAFEATIAKREMRVGKENRWLIHVGEFRRQNPELGYREMLQRARETYTPMEKPPAPEEIPRRGIVSGPSPRDGSERRPTRMIDSEAIEIGAKPPVQIVVGGNTYTFPSTLTPAEFQSQFRAKHKKETGLATTPRDLSKEASQAYERALKSEIKK